MIHILSCNKLENIISKLNVIPKTTGKCMSFTIKQPKRKNIKLGLLLVLTDSVHFSNNSLDN